MTIHWTAAIEYGILIKLPESDRASGATPKKEHPSSQSNHLSFATKCTIAVAAFIVALLSLYVNVLVGVVSVALFAALGLIVYISGGIANILEFASTYNSLRAYVFAIAFSLIDTMQLAGFVSNRFATFSHNINRVPNLNLPSLAKPPQAFTKVTPPSLEPANEVLDTVQGFGLPSIGFVHVFAGTVTTVALFFVIMIVQETVEWNAFMGSGKTGWAYLFSAMAFYCEIVSGPGLIPITKQLFRAVDCTHHVINNSTVREDQLIFETCVANLEHEPAVIAQERKYGGSVCLQEAHWQCTTNDGVIAQRNATFVPAAAADLYGETVWRMDSDPCIECWVSILPGLFFHFAAPVFRSRTSH
jgi:hypothetical protein